MGRVVLPLPHFPPLLLSSLSWQQKRQRTKRHARRFGSSEAAASSLSMTSCVYWREFSRSVVVVVVMPISQTSSERLQCTEVGFLHALPLPRARSHANLLSKGGIEMTGT
jgi:hypothetical protein